MEKFHSILAARDAGFSLLSILQWIEQYTLPVLLRVLPLILPLLLAGKVTLQQAIGWVVVALADVATGKPVPPLPA